MIRQLDKVLLNAELVRYLVVGALTTLINYLCFLFSTAVIHMPWTYANIAAWIVSVVFAFVTNRKLVFNSKGSWKKECISFFFLRFISLLAEFLFLYLMIDKMMVNEQISKIVTNIVVIILNYIFCHTLIFKK